MSYSPYYNQAPPPAPQAAYPYAQPAYVHHPPPPPPDAQEAFRHFYRSHLATLTFNSRPIINHLTQLALDQIADFPNANIVADEIAKGVFEAQPQHKLPLFYLLDSIAKNFPVPYAALFTRHIPHLFAAAYASVDGATKAKLEEMLRTWRAGGLKGAPVFGMPVQEELESRTWGRDYVRQMQQQAIYAKAQQAHHAPPPVASSQPPPPVYYPPPVHQQHYPAPTPSPYPVHHSPYPPPTLAHPVPGYSTPPTVSTTPLPPPPAAPSAPGLDTSLLSILSGLLGHGGLQQGSASPAPRPETADSSLGDIEQEGSVGGATTQDVPAVEEEEEEVGKAGFEQLVLELDVRLETLDLKAKLPRISNILTLHLPLQCRICGLRAPQTARGDRHLQLHSDWHSRTAKRARESESEGRGNSRAWFVDAKDWVNDQSLPIDLIPPTTTVAPTTSAVKKATLSAALRAELMQKTIVQPSDPEMAARPCPICKETFKGEFSDEEEEWLWANAVEENGIVYHATCKHDADRGSSRLLQASSTAPEPETTGLQAKSEPPSEVDGVALNNKRSLEPETAPGAGGVEEDGRGKRVKLEQEDQAL